MQLTEKMAYCYYTVMRKSVINTYDNVDVRKIVREELNTFKGEMRDEIVGDVEGKLTELKSEIMNGIDEVMGEIKAGREERILTGNKLSEHSDQLEDHEQRISRFEKTPVAA